MYNDIAMTVYFCYCLSVPSYMFSQPYIGPSSNEQDSCVCACVCKWSYAVQTIFYSTVYRNDTTGFQDHRLLLAYLRRNSSTEKPQGRICNATSLNYGGQKLRQRMIQIFRQSKTKGSIFKHILLHGPNKATPKKFPFSHPPPESAFFQH